VISRSFAVFVLYACCLATPAMGEAGTAPYHADEALQRSQAVIGKTLQPLVLQDSSGLPFDMQQLQGRPVLVSLVFTSCYHVCPAITKHLASAVRDARAALGTDSFQVLTIGFDTVNDTPTAMANFARAQNVQDPDWFFLSADKDTMVQLTADLGFSYFPTPRGFDHINQLTLIDRDGVIYRQIYGAAFELPAVVEPLKELVYNRPVPGTPFVASLIDRIRLYCTVYDPTSGRYRFDFSLFVQIAVGGIFLLVLAGWLLQETLKARRSRVS